MAPQPPVTVSISIHADIPLTHLSEGALEELFQLVQRLRVLHDQAEKSKEATRVPAGAFHTPPAEPPALPVDPPAPRQCGYKGCGQPLVRKVYGSGKLESPSAFDRRDYCDRSCARKANVDKGHRSAPKQTPVMEDGRQCRTCGKPLVRKRRRSGQLEALVEFRERRTCDVKCGGAAQRGQPKPGSGKRRKPKLPKEQRPIEPPPTPTPPPPAPLPTKAPVEVEPMARFDPRPEHMRPGYDSGAGGMRVVERVDTGSCGDCGAALDAFGKCRDCDRREAWRAGQRTLRPRVTSEGSS